MVHFVGAGSGAPDLITIRGKKFLESADIIIYAGSLVNPQLLEYAKPECEIFDSAKMTLEEVIDVILRGEGEDVYKRQICGIARRSFFRTEHCIPGCAWRP